HQVIQRKGTVEVGRNLPRQFDFAPDRGPACPQIKIYFLSRLQVERHVWTRSKTLISPGAEMDSDRNRDRGNAGKRESTLGIGLCLQVCGLDHWSFRAMNANEMDHDRCFGHGPPP